MKIAIFEGSFNPISKSHIAIAQMAIKDLSLDRLFFVPIYKSLYDSKLKLIDAQHRVNMIELAKPEKSEVSLFQVNRKNSVHMYEVVSYFKKQYPNAELFILIGSDKVSNLTKWKEMSAITSQAEIIVYKRNNNFSKEIIKRFNGTLMKNEVVSYSSEEFRKGQMHNVTKPVIDYIADNFLYAPELMISMLDAKRHKHSVAVAQMAAELAKANNYDAKKAWFAGSMHDITKWWPKEAHREFLTYVGVNEADVEDYELHAMTGYWWLKTQYQLKDEEILNAVLRHTSLAKELTLLDKIIFAADKLAEGRKFDGIQDIRKLIFEDFDKGFKAIVAKTYQQLLEVREMTFETKRTYEEWI